MKNLFFFLFLLNGVNLLSQAQWVLTPELSADYECTIGTFEEHGSRGRVQVSYTIQDTLFFDVQRKVQARGGNWEIGYNILKPYEYGLFRNEKPQYSPVFPTDKWGNLSKDYALKKQLSALDKKIFDFLKLTILPFPTVALKDDYIWKATINGQVIKFSVLDGLQSKLGRKCFRIRLESETTPLKGDLFLEKDSGQIVYLEITNSQCAFADCYSNNTRIRLSIKDPGGLIEAKIKEFSLGEADIMRLHQSYNWLAPLAFQHVESLSNDIDHRGFIVQQNGFFGWLSETGQTILPPVQNMIDRAAGRLMYWANGNNICLIDQNKRVLMDSLDEHFTGYGPQHHVEPALRKGKWLLIDQNGAVLETYPHSSYVQLGTNGEEDGMIKVQSRQRKYGLLKEGRVIIPVEFTNLVQDQYHKLILAYKDSTAYLFDMEGNLKFSRKGGSIELIVGDFYAIKDEGLYNWKTGKFIYADKDFIYPDDLRDKFFIIFNAEDLSKSLFDSLGQLIGKFNNIEVKDESRIMIASDIESELFGILNFDGTWLLNPIYKSISQFENGVFVAESPNWKESKAVLGLINISGETILPIHFDKIYNLRSGKYYIENSTQKGIFDLANHSFAPFPENLQFQGYQYLGESIYLIAQKEGKKGLLDLDFNEIVPFEFNKIGSITRYGVVVETHGKWGVIKRP